MIKFNHIHLNDDGNSVPKTYSIFTIASKIETNSDGVKTITLGYAHKKPGDEFCKKTGNDLAQSRMKYKYILPQSFNDATSIKFWSVTMLASYMFELAGETSTENEYLNMLHITELLLDYSANLLSGVLDRRLGNGTDYIGTMHSNLELVLNVITLSDSDKLDQNLELLFNSFEVKEIDFAKHRVA